MPETSLLLARLEGEIYLLTVYRKGVKDDLRQAERASWRKVVEEIKHG